MNEECQAVAQAAHALASRLPYTIAMTVAEVLGQVQVPAWPGIRTALLHRLPTAAFRDATSDFLDQWQGVAAIVSAQTAAMALRTAAHALKISRQEQTAEIVWTGPAMTASPFRQTEQAMLEVLQAATSRLMVISFAIYHIPRIQGVFAQSPKKVYFTAYVPFNLLIHMLL
jgi:hypothetical protein